MKIDTNRFKESLSFLGLAISKNNTDRPATKMIELSVDNNFLYGYTCDGTNNIKMKICAATEDIFAVVTFASLYDIIKSCDDDNIEIKTTDKSLNIKSDSMKCKIPVYTNFNNKNSCIPHPTTPTNTTDIDFSNLSDILPICKSLVDPKFTIECYRYIYFNDKIMVSDTDNVAIIDKQIFNESLLLSLHSIEILSKLEACKYNITAEKSNLGKDYKRLTIVNDEIELLMLSFVMDEYQYNDLIDLFNLPMNNKATISKDIFSKAVSMSQLFKHNPMLVFDDNGASLQIPQSDFVYKLDPNNVYEEHKYNITPDILKKLLANNSDLELYFGSNEILKCISGDTQEIFSIEEVK